MTVPMPDGSKAQVSTWTRSQLILGWALVSVPLVYGVYETLLKAAQLF
jgi:hypothetical protein